MVRSGDRQSWHRRIKSRLEHSRGCFFDLKRFDRSEQKPLSSISIPFRQLSEYNVERRSVKEGLHFKGKDRVASSTGLGMSDVQVCELQQRKRKKAESEIQSRL